MGVLGACMIPSGSTSSRAVQVGGVGGEADLRVVIDKRETLQAGTPNCLDRIRERSRED
jgi:hypothetical protein